MGSIKLYFAAFILTALLASGWAVKNLYDTNQSLTSQVSSLQEELKDKEAEISKITKESSQLRENLSKSREILRQREVYLSSMKNREGTVLAKPKLVEKLIHKAVKDREKRFECATGGLCEP